MGVSVGVRVGRGVAVSVAVAVAVALGRAVSVAVGAPAVSVARWPAKPAAISVDPAAAVAATAVSKAPGTGAGAEQAVINCSANKAASTSRPGALLNGKAKPPEDGGDEWALKPVAAPVAASQSLFYTRMAARPAAGEFQGCLTVRFLQPSGWCSAPPGRGLSK